MSWWPRAGAEEAAIAPSILSADASRLGDEVRAMASAGADLIHLDVMDGHFVPNLTYGPHVAECVRSVTDLPIDCHLMVTDPQTYGPRFVEAGATMVSFHWELDLDHAALADELRSLGGRPGLVLNPPTPLDDRFRAVLGHLDFVLVMSVMPGFSGQSFDPAALPKLQRLRSWRAEDGLDLALEIDGGIDLETAPRAREAGADILVSGSTLFRSDDYAAMIRRLRGPGADREEARG